MTAQNLVKKRLWWKVGNGSNIRVWGHKWLPTSSTYKVASPRQFLHPDTRVSELINPETASWRSNILDALFLPYEADVIKSIPINSRLPANKLIWAESPNGHFSVRSAYAVEVRLSRPGNFSATSNNSQNQRFWK